MLQQLLFLGLRQEHKVLEQVRVLKTHVQRCKNFNSVSVPAVWRQSSLTVATCSNHLAPQTSLRLVSSFADYWRLRITKQTPAMSKKACNYQRFLRGKKHTLKSNMLIRFWGHLREVNFKIISVLHYNIIGLSYPYVVNPYPTAFPYGNGMVLHFYQQQESSTTKIVHKVINKGLKTYV